MEYATARLVSSQAQMVLALLVTALVQRVQMDSKTVV
jgi:hypothetical protein